MAEPRRDAQVAAVAALAEPTRRRLYDYVVAEREAVSRDQAAEALGLRRTTAAFHLDRLAEQGLLEVRYQRRTGRTGPGAGRPAKLYRRSGCEVAVSLPERHYDLAGQLLATALEEADSSGEPPRTVLGRHAHRVGRELAEAAGASATSEDSRSLAWQLLQTHGYEPRVDGTGVALANCPFHTLAQQHTELVCGMNLRMLTGLLDGFAHCGLSARLDPAPGRCCVRLEPALGPAG